MTQRQLRTPVAALTASFAVAALLAGPAVTWGLDVTAVGTSDGTASQVTTTTQSVVGTVQQTAASTVTTVETTAQTTDPTTVAQVPATTQAQTTAWPVTTAPKAAAPRTTSSVQKQTTSTAIHKAPVRQVSANTGVTRQSSPAAAGSLLQTAARGAAPQARPHVPATTRSTAGLASPVRPSSRQVRSNCGLPVLDLLSGASGLDGLLTIVCNATANLALPVSIGNTRAAGPALSIGKVLGLVLAGGAPVDARAAALRRYSLAAAGRRPAAVSQAAHRSDRAAGLGHAGSIHRAAGTHPGARYQPRLATSGGTRAARAGGHARHEVFSSPDTSTGPLTLVLLIDAALFAAIILWRVARRWFIPRFP